MIDFENELRQMDPLSDLHDDKKKEDADDSKNAFIMNDILI